MSGTDGNVRWSVETSATIGAAEAVTRTRGWMQGGRLGVELVTGHDTALEVAQRLKRKTHHKVWLSPERVQGTREDAEDGLKLYRDARARLLGWIHGALESEMTPEKISKLSGMSLDEVQGTIVRYNLESWVKGE